MIEHLLFTHSIQKSEEWVVWFHCPACGFRNVQGAVWSERHNTRFLNVIPVMKEDFNWAKGSCCQRQLISRMEARALAAIDADEIEAKRLLIERYSAVSIVFLIGAFLLFAAPIIGPVFLICAWLVGGSSRPWFRVACRVILFLHLFVMNALVMGLIVFERR